MNFSEQECSPYKLCKTIDIPLTIEQFQKLPINQKLKYNIAHPMQNLWGKAEKQELQAIANKLCYALPYAALNGEINIFSIEPAFRVESEKPKVESTAQNTKQGEFLLGEGGLGGLTLQLI